MLASVAQLLASATSACVAVVLLRSPKKRKGAPEPPAAAAAPAAAAGAKYSHGDLVLQQDTAALNRMLGVMRYQSSASFKGSEEQRQQAESAKHVYKSLKTNAERHAFLKAFQQAGQMKTPEGWKFHTRFRRTVVQQNSSSVSAVENWLLPSQILQQAGMTMNDFPDRASACKFAVGLWQANQQQFGTEEHKPNVNADPLMTKYFWIEFKGKTREVAEIHSTTLEQHADSKDLKAHGKSPGLETLQMQMMDAPGQDAGSSGDAVVPAAGDVQVKSENPAWERANAHMKSVRSLVWCRCQEHVMKHTVVASMCWLSPFEGECSNGVVSLVCLGCAGVPFLFLQVHSSQPAQAAVAVDHNSLQDQSQAPDLR